MNVIFLDVDGVLNCNRRARPGTGFSLKSFTLPEAVERLNRIYDATLAMVVVSSTWRIGKNRSQLAEAFSKCGYRGLIYGSTIVGSCSMHEGVECSEGHRGAEIGEWIGSHRDRISEFVIIDDESDMGVLRSHLVQTDGTKGLQDADVEAVIAKLGRIEV